MIKLDPFTKQSINPNLLSEIATKMHQKPNREPSVKKQRLACITRPPQHKYTTYKAHNGGFKLIKQIS